MRIRRTKEGMGSFGAVWLCKADNGSHMALKEMHVLDINGAQKGQVGSVADFADRDLMIRCGIQYLD